MFFFDSQAQYYPVPGAQADNYTRENFAAAVHHLFGTTEAFGTKNFEAAEKIVAFYDTQKANYHRNYYLHLFTQLISDTTFDVPSLREVREKVAAKNKVYFYLYNFLPENLKNAQFDGVPHTSELINFFGNVLGFKAMPLKGDVAKVQKTMIDLFINFVKIG